MRARVLTAVAALPLLGAAACGGGLRTASSQSAGDHVSCAGWYEVSHNVLTAEVQLDGAVHEVAVDALLDDGHTRGTPTPLRVPAGSSHRTIRVPGVETMVVSAHARVIGATDGVQGSCELSVPH